MLYVRLFFELVGVHTEVLGMSFIFLNRPAAVLDRLKPAFEPILIILRWLGPLLLVHHEGIIAAGLLLELAVHILPAVPVELTSAG